MPEAWRTTRVPAKVVETVNEVSYWKASCAALLLRPITVKVASAPAPPLRLITWPSMMSLPPFQVPRPALTLVASGLAAAGSIVASTCTQVPTVMVESAVRPVRPVSGTPSHW